MKWTTKGFEAFRRGKFGNGGHNIYVSRQGVLQRIHQTDVKRSGYMDLVFCNSQNHEEWVPIKTYSDPINHPEKFTQINIGGAYDAVVADLTGTGQDSIVWGCWWDGMTYYTPSAIVFPSEKAPGSHCMSLISVDSIQAVAAGDFDGDGRCDVALYSPANQKIWISWQKEYGFTNENLTAITLPDDKGKKMTAYHFPGEKNATLFLSNEDGSVLMFKSFDPENAKPEEVFPADPDFVSIFSGHKGRQHVEDAPPRIQFINIRGKDHLALFRKAGLYLYPVEGNGFGEPVKIDCPNGIAVAAGDIYGRNCTDLVIAARDLKNDREYSYLYHGDKGIYSNDNRLEFKTYFACDVALENFSGGKGLDIIILQGHTIYSFDNDVLCFPTGNAKPGKLPKPTKIPAHGSFRIVTAKDTQGRPYLVVGNQNSGSKIGDPDNFIYLGSAGGYTPENRIELPGNGSVDAICADLNDNGRPDFVFANAAELSPWRDPGSYIFHQKEDGTYDRKPTILNTSRAHGLACGDLNHNGYLDLIVSAAGHNKLKIFYGSENGYTDDNAQEIVMKEGDKEYRSSVWVTAADLNGNGYLDIIATQLRQSESFILWGGPDGYSWENKQTLKVWNICFTKIADLNGNGYPDLILAAHTPSPGKTWNSYVYIYWGGPEGYSESRRQQLPCNACNGLAIADFNNDGLLDIFVGSYEDGYNRDLPSFIYWNSPDGFDRLNRTEIPTHAVSGCCAGDFNNDGYVDIAVGNHKYNTKHICDSQVFYNGPAGFDIVHPTHLPTIGVHGMCQTDAGNIMDRSFNEYYESEVYEMPANCGIKGFNVTGSIPHKCAVYAQFRCADTLEALAQEDWQGPTEGNSFKPLQSVEKQRFTGKYMQYRLNLWAFNGLNTPRISEVTVEFEEL